MFGTVFMLWKTSLRQQWFVYFIVLAAFALGLAAGSAGVGKLPIEQAELLQLEVERFLLQAGWLEIDYSLAARDVLLNDFILLAAIYLLGLTIIGIPFVLVILFIRGFALGFAIDFLITGESVQGTVLVLAAVLPQNILMVPALLLAAAGAVSFACLLAKRFHNSNIQVWPGFIAYSGVMIVAAVCFACAGLLEVYLTPLLIKLAAGYVF